VQRRDASDRERLILQYLPLVRSLARGFAHDAGEFEELVQVGSIGLIKAVDRFDSTRGVELAAYARPTVAGEIRRHLRDAAPSIRPPRRLHELNGRLRRLRRELGAALGRTATTRELAQAAGTTEDRAAAAAALDRNLVPVPLDDDAVPVDPYAAADDRLVLAERLSRFDEQTRRVLRLRLAGLTQREIAVTLGIPQVRVSRVTSRALESLRSELSEIVVPVAKS